MISGATASGKTELAVRLALRYNAEIVGADSRQIYRGMAIGTAAPSPEQLAAVPHHLIGVLDPFERYSAARFVADATRVIHEIHARGKRAIVAGGTGFYIRALTGAVQLAPQGDAQTRERLAREAEIHDAAFLYDWLCVRDPKRAAALHPRDVYRNVRALEVTFTPAGERRPTMVAQHLEGLRFLKIYLDVEEAELQARIERRARRMLDNGFIDEAQRVGLAAVASSAVGYPLAIAYLEGRCTRAELLALLIRATQRYSKRQKTWFRSEPQILFARPADVQTLARELLAWV